MDSIQSIVDKGRNPLVYIFFIFLEQVERVDGRTARRLDA
jgi:hypothetical protein